MPWNRVVGHQHGHSVLLEPKSVLVADGSQEVLDLAAEGFELVVVEVVMVHDCLGEFVDNTPVQLPIVEDDAETLSGLVLGLDLALIDPGNDLLDNLHMDAVHTVQVQGSTRNTRVEPRGIEPLTSCLQSRRSTN